MIRKIPLLSEALGDLGAALGFSALALEVARTGEALWVGLFAVMGYLTLGPLLLLSPWVDRAHPARALLLLRLLRGLLWLPFPFLPREAALLVLLAYPLMVATDLAVVAWETLLLRVDRGGLLGNTGRLYAAWNLGGLLGSLLGPPLLLLHPALPYLAAAGALLLSLGLLLPWLQGLSPSGSGRRETGIPLGKALALVAGHRPLRPYLLLSLLFALAHALATALLGLLVLRAGTPEGLFGLFFALQDLGYTLGSYGAGRVPQIVALLGGPLLAGFGLLLVLLPFPFLLLGGGSLRSGHGRPQRPPPGPPGLAPPPRGPGPRSGRPSCPALRHRHPGRRLGRSPGPRRPHPTPTAWFPGLPGLPPLPTGTLAPEAASGPCPLPRGGAGNRGVKQAPPSS